MRNTIILGLIIIASYLQIKFWFRLDGIRGIINIKDLIKVQEQELAEMQQRNAQLLANVKLLRENPNALEEYARVNLGMVKHDEVYYRIID